MQVYAATFGLLEESGVFACLSRRRSWVQIPYSPFGFLTKGEIYDERLEQLETQMQKTVGFLFDQLRGFHSSNICSGMVKSIRVQCYEQMTPLEHLASIVEKDRRINLQVYDVTLVDAVTKKLKDSGFDAYKFTKNVIVINIPLPSGEQTRKVFKRIKELGEETKIALRNLRRKWKKQGVDEKNLNILTAKYIEKVDEMVGN